MSQLLSTRAKITLLEPAVHDGGTTSFVPFGESDPVKLSVAVVKDFVAVKTKSGKTCTDADAMKFIAMCRARKLNPFAGDAYLIGYDTKDGPQFSLITSHQALLKRAETHPEFDGMESGVVVADHAGVVVDREGDFFVKGDTVLGGWAVVHFKTRRHPMRKRVRLEVFNKGFGRWNVDPAGMIVKCAEADALRSSFPSMLGGMYLEGEPAERVTEAAPQPSQIAARIGRRPSAVLDGPDLPPSTPADEASPTEEPKPQRQVGDEEEE